MPKKKRYYDKMQGKRDGLMIAGAVGIANMPQNVIMKYYAKGETYLVENLNDGMSGVDMQKKSDVGGAKKNLSTTKY